jgi:hypothetical protein
MIHIKMWSVNLSGLQYVRGEMRISRDLALVLTLCVGTFPNVYFPGRV